MQRPKEHTHSALQRKNAVTAFGEKHVYKVRFSLVMGRLFKMTHFYSIISLKHDHNETLKLHLMTEMYRYLCLTRDKDEVMAFFLWCR